MAEVNERITDLRDQNTLEFGEYKDMQANLRELLNVAPEHKKMSYAPTLKKELEQELKNMKNAKDAMDKVQRDINALKA